MDTKTMIDGLSKEFDFKREETKSLISDFCKILSDCCIDGDILFVSGFGQFEPKKRLERVAVHPATGKRLLVPPKLVVSFKPSGVLKNKIKGA